MTNNELNQFILHYLVEDKTHSAIMLTGAWGTGKSYYIQNELVPFLKEEHEKECVTVSLYGIKSTAEISRSIYIELRAKTLSAKGEAAVAGKLIAKTIVRGVVSRFGIDFSKENDTMQELYESINLSNKLVILEDIERSQIEVIELLGYVNSLVEQDNVKVLLVANENEMLKYNGDAKELPLFEQEWSDEEGGSHSLKHPLRKYLTVKEKTVSDTIQYTGDYEGAVSQIIKSFGNPILDKFANDSSVKTICGFMDTFKHLLTSTVRVSERLNWQVLHASDDVSFPTSDDPVICLNYNNERDYDFDGGWGIKHGNILMPISPKLLLFSEIGEKGSYPDLDYSPMYSKLFREMIIRHAHRYVYAEHPQKGMLALNARVVNRDWYEAEKHDMAGWHIENIKAEANL